MKVTGLNEGMRDLTGQVIAKDLANNPLLIKEAIANALAGSSTQEPARTMSLATTIYESNGAVELEPLDIEYVIDLVTKAALPDVAKVACITALKRASE